MDIKPALSAGASETYSQRTHWDTVAADYEAMAEPFTGQYARAALALAGGVRRGMDVLDVAAGTGALTLAAARDGAHVLGTDFSPAMVARLSARLEAGRYANCAARVMDGQALDLDEATFDLAFSIFGIIAFPDWRRGLAELARVVRPGGRGCVAVWTRTEGAGPSIAFDEAYRLMEPDAISPPSPPGVIIMADAQGLAGTMADAGFKNVSVHTIAGAFEAPSAAWMIGNIDRLFRLVPRFAALDEDDRSKLIAKLGIVLPKYETRVGLRIPSDAHVAIGER